MNSKRMPPLNALRAFEAAARHGSFSRAAEELSVTRAAISQQIKLLEDYLGTTLFHRRAQKLALSDSGKNYLPALHRAFNLMRDATEQLFFHPQQGAINLRISTTFAQQWLIPRLEDFYRRHPHLRLKLFASTWRLQNEHAPDIDLEIFNGDQQQVPHNAIALTDDEWLVVASPRLLERSLAGCETPLTTEDILRLPLIGTLGYRQGWHEWLRRQGIESAELNPALETDTSSFGIAAARAGVGAYLGQRAALEQELASGELCQIHPFTLPSQHHYYLLRHAEGERPDLDIFCQWLQSKGC